MCCNARCGMLCLIHHNVAVMLYKVRCRIFARYGVMLNVMCNVRCGVKCGDAMWNDVVHGEYVGVL